MKEKTTIRGQKRRKEETVTKALIKYFQNKITSMGYIDGFY